MVYKKSRRSRRSRRRSRVSRRKHKRHSRKRRAGNPLAIMAYKIQSQSRYIAEAKARGMEKLRKERDLAMTEAKGIMRNKLRDIGRRHTTY